MSLKVLEINNKEPKDDIALSTLEEHHQMTNEQQKTSENGESLFTLEKKIREIGQHRREKQQQKQLLFGGLMLQGTLIALISPYCLRTRAIRIMRYTLRLCGKRRRPASNGEDTPAA